MTKIITTSILLLSATVIFAQEYKFTAKQNDAFSVAFVDVVNNAGTDFSSYRGQASKSSFGDDQFLLNKTIPGFAYGNVNVSFNKAACYLYKVNLGSEAAAKTELDNLALTIAAAFGNNIQLVGKGKSALFGDYNAIFRLVDANGYFLSNINVSQGYGMIDYNEYDNNKSLTKKLYDFPSNHYIKITVKGGVPDYYYTIAKGLPVINKSLCEMVNRLFKESQTAYQSIRSNKRPHKLFSNTFEYDCSLSLSGWTILISESSLGLEMKMERDISEQEFMNRQALAGSKELTTGQKLLNDLVAELKPCVGESYVYTMLGKEGNAYSIKPAEASSKAPSVIVSFFESSFSKTRKLIITIKAK